MKKYDDELEPLDFDDIKTDWDYDNYESDSEPTIPILTKGTIKNDDSNFVFFFGSPSSGKQVILASLFYTLRAYYGDLKPKANVSNSRQAETLLHDFLENITKGVLPRGTAMDTVTRLDYTFTPNNKSKKIKPIDLTFLETAGGNHLEIKQGGKYNDKIQSYLDAQIPISIIIVTSYDRASKEDTLINTFLDHLEKRSKSIKSVNIILVISKWDKSQHKEAEDLSIVTDFIQEKLPMTYNRLNTYGITKTYYTIGKVNEHDNRITELDLRRAKVLGNWLYESITGYPIEYKGTFWEQIKFSFRS